jgi:preprotein translocase subunit SecG
MILAASTFMHFLFGTVILLISIFLILLVLVQRGRGGGLTGALGGMGGQSAFGTKAGDTFTRITYGAAIVWICVCMLAIKVLHRGSDLARGVGGPSGASSVEADKTEGAGTSKTAAPAGEEKSTGTPAPKSDNTDK